MTATGGPNSPSDTHDPRGSRAPATATDSIAQDTVPRGYGAIALNIGIAAALAAMVAFAFVQRWHLLTVSPYPVGIDGYFYPLQIRHLLEHGTLQYESSPLTFYFMAPFALATDPITGAKLGAALGGALIAIPAYGVGARLGGNRGAGLLAAALTSASAGGVYLSLEFVKQGFGLTVALAAVWCILRALDAPSDRSALIAAIAAVATFTTHKLPSVMLVIVALPAVAYEVRHRLHGRRLIYALLVTAGVVLAIVVLGLVAPQRVPSVTDLALIGDAFTPTARWDAPALVTEHLTLAFDHEAAVGGIVALLAALALGMWLLPRKPSPTERDGHHTTRNPLPLRTRPDQPEPSPADEPDAPPTAELREEPPTVPRDTAELRDALPSTEVRDALPRAVLLDRRTMRDMLVGAMLVAIALAIALPWLAVTDAQGIGFRLRVAAFVPLALCATIVARAVMQLADEHPRHVVERVLVALVMIPLLPLALCAAIVSRAPLKLARLVSANKHVIELALVVVATIVFVRGMRADRTEGRVLTHPALATAVMAAEDQVPANATVIVPERHILFMAAWYTRAPVSLRPEPIPYAQRVRMFGLVFIQGIHSPLDRALDRARSEPSITPPLGLHPRYRNGLVLVTEPTWDWLLAQLPDDVRAYFRAWPTI